MFTPLHLTIVGFPVAMPSGGTVTARARLLMYCEDKGVPRQNTHRHCNWPYSSNCVIRTHDGIVSNTKTALRNRAPVCSAEHVAEYKD